MHMNAVLLTSHNCGRGPRRVPSYDAVNGLIMLMRAGSLVTDLKPAVGASRILDVDPGMPSPEPTKASIPSYAWGLAATCCHNAGATRIPGDGQSCSSLPSHPLNPAEREAHRLAA